CVYGLGSFMNFCHRTFAHCPPRFNSNDIATLACLKSNWLRATEKKATAIKQRFRGSLLLPLLVGTSCSRHDDSTPAEAKGKGRVTIVYQDDAILPEKPRRNKENQGLTCVRTDGGPPNESSGATSRPPSHCYRQDSQGHRCPDERDRW